jgi:hypothetical protein
METVTVEDSHPNFDRVTCACGGQQVREKWQFFRERKTIVNESKRTKMLKLEKRFFSFVERRGKGISSICGKKEDSVEKKYIERI